MKLIFLKFILLTAATVAMPQDMETEVDVEADKPLVAIGRSSLMAWKADRGGDILDEIRLPPIERFIPENAPLRPPEPLEAERDEPPAALPEGGGDKFHWKPALMQSTLFLAIQHGARMSQKKTRHGLGGPFFREWAESVKGLRSWDDDGLFVTNYIAHPLQGSLTGRIFINNSEKAKRQEFGRSKQYWEGRFKAMAWSAFWSTQFELGPFSEASIGNVGMQPTKFYGKMGWNDLIVTPIMGTGALVGEDMIEKYVLKGWLERKLTSRTRIKIWRTFLTPTTSFANLLAGKKPWKRDDRD
jgi:hypothetical protein